MSSNIQKWLRSDNNVICDVCGRLKKKSQTVLAFGTGDIPVVVSCRDRCADYRHPLNSPPPVIFDGQPVRDARPEATDNYDTTSMDSTVFIWGRFPNGSNTWGNMGSGNLGDFRPYLVWGQSS